MPEWFGWAVVSSIFVVLVLAWGTKVIARIWHFEKRRHHRKMLAMDPEENVKEIEDELER